MRNFWNSSRGPARHSLLLGALLLSLTPAVGSSQPGPGPAAVLAVAGFSEGHVLIEYSESGEALRQIDLVDPDDLLGSPSGLTMLDGTLWVGGANSVHPLDPTSGEISAGFTAADGPTLTALCADGVHLLVGDFIANTFKKFDSSGNLLSEITLDTQVFMVGADSDGQNIYVPSHATGNVHIFDMAGTTVGLIETNLPSDMTAIALDPDGETFWIATGTGTNAVHRFDFAGNLLQSFPGTSPGIMGLYALAPSLFEDGFESGDTSAWTNVVN